ncbi:MAG: endonuclease [Sphingobacteriales bacterium]|nr:MAG: endonuclease [Sphingobacteriales bacterium]
MKIFLIVAAILFAIMILLPISKKEYWWIRIFDYPRVQISTGSILVIALILIYGYTSWPMIILMLILGAGTIYQAVLIYPYTPFSKVQTLKSQNLEPEIKIKLLANNVRQVNKNIDKVLAAIGNSDPDIIVLMETDKTWYEGVKHLEEKYPFTLLEPLDNTYGMIFFSRLKIYNGKVKNLTDKEIPSIHCIVELPSGDKINLYCLHPQPPTPHSDTEKRDAEIIMVGKEIKKTGEPSIVCGDLNDVAWSHTTRLFQRISGMSDPRVGRGFFNTYNAFIPFFRFPLDHIFHTKHFRMVDLKRLKQVGSDHFPMFVALSYEPEKKNIKDIPKPDSDDHEEANEKIEQVK